MSEYVNNHIIEIIFENCESITIKDSAIEHLRMKTDGESYELDGVSKTFTEKKELSKLYLMLNLRDKENFFHMFDTTKKTFSDEGSKCIDRLRFSDDITSIKINGIDYHVPWDSEKVIYDKELPIPCYKNKLQKNTESKNSYGHDILTIEIKK